MSRHAFLTHLILLILVSLLALWPFFHKGYFPTHDGEWMVIRATAFHRTLRSGQFPVRFVDRLNNNYGYPVMNFLYPLPFYGAEVPKILGFGFVDSVKTVFVISSVLSVVAMFWALRQMFTPAAAFAGALIYLFIPYRFVDLYVRGSIGENFAFAIIPLIFGSIIKIQKGHKIFYPLLSISTALLILSHNVIAVLFIPLFILLSAVAYKKSLITITASMLLGVLLSAFFTIPAIYDLQYVRLSQIKVSNISDHLVPLGRLIIPSWGYGPNPNGQDAMSVQIGLIAITILLASIYLLIIRRKKNPLAPFLATLLIIAVLLMDKQSQFIWQAVPKIDIIQFPWRLLSLIVFITSFLASFVIDSQNKKKPATALLIAIAVISSVLYIKPQSFVDRGDSYYATNEGTTTVADEYLPLWVKEKPKDRANEKIIISQGQITSQNIRPSNYEAVIFSNGGTKVQVNTIYFPGWQVKVDPDPCHVNLCINSSDRIDHPNNNNGLINFELPKGKHKVIIEYTESSVHLASDLISLAALLATGVLSIYLWRKRKS